MVVVPTTQIILWNSPRYPPLSFPFWVQYFVKGFRLLEREKKKREDHRQTASTTTIVIACPFASCPPDKMIVQWFIVLAFHLPTFISFHIHHLSVRTITTSLSAKAVDLFVCNECGMEHIKWVGRCTSCKEWNSVKPFRQAKLAPVDAPFSVRTKVASMKQSSLSSSNPAVVGSENKVNSAWFGSSAPVLGAATLIPLESVDLNRVVYRVPLFSDEMNRVLGGGLVRGSVTLLAGDPGIGKSTLLLQLASSIASADSSTVVYMSGEENQEQITARAQRLGLAMRPRSTYLICDVDVDNAIDMILRMSPDGPPPALVIVDSIQTMRTGATTSGIGTVSQIRESAARFVELAKTTGKLVGNVSYVTTYERILSYTVALSISHTLSHTLPLTLSHTLPLTLSHTLPRTLPCTLSFTLSFTLIFPLNRYRRVTDRTRDKKR